MPDYIYLLENKLSADQQSALRQLRDVAREADTILFLTGDAVRELTSGSPVRSLEVAVRGNALKLKKAITKLGGKVWGEDEEASTIYLCFPGTVRVDLVSMHRVEYPKPGKAVYHPASILEDLRRRDFTINAMAISLNEGSFGLLMDPMNGVADLEAQTLRLVSNYGFLEEPSLLIRATRYKARLGWEMDPKTQTRYTNAREEGVIEYLTPQARRQELEQIGHEGDGLKVLSALEAEGWMEALFPAWTTAKANQQGLTELNELAAELLAQGVHADRSAAQMRLLTSGLSGRELANLKKQMLRPGFVEEWESLDSLASGFAKVLLSKEKAKPSVGYKLFTSYDPEAILWLGFTSKDEAVKQRYHLFLKEWPEVRQRIPHALMQEMRITPELPAYNEIVHTFFLELIDGKLTTPEEARAFLEPHSPPAPPPREVIKRPRAKRGAEAKIKEDSFDDEEEPADAADDEDDLDDIGGDDDEIDLGMILPKVEMDVDLDDADADDEDDDEDEHPKPPAPKPAAKQSAAPAKSSEALKPQAAPSSKAQLKQEKPAPAKVEAKPKSAPAPAKAAQASAKKPVPSAKPAAKSPVKAPAKPAAKPAPKPPAKKPLAKTSAKETVKASAPKSAPAAKKKPAPKTTKHAAKKPASKPAKKR
jgi:tRNA nucleotidyltransferase/poly(A) polymerase